MTESDNAVTDSILDRLGSRVATLSYDDLTESGRRLFRVALVDTLGVALAGSGFPGAVITRAALHASLGESLILGSPDRVDVLDAAMLNAIAAHALDYDDGNPIMGGHPSTLLIPAVLAVGEELGASATEVIAAYAAGYEVIIRLSRGINSAHYEKGWHPTSTIGVFGVAAAAARLLGLDAKQCTVALAIAASMASGVKANFGTMVKSLHVGHAVRDGLLCARLAAGGFTANRLALEARQGFLDVYNGAGSYELQAIVADRGALEINTGFNPIKAYPCCASTHSAIGAAMDIRRTHGVRGQEVETVRIVVDKNRMPHTDRPHLQEALSGKFSLQYVVARALLEGRVVLEHFENDAHLDPSVQALMGRIEVSAAPPGEVPNSFAANVSVTVGTGETFHSRVDRPALGGDGTTADPPHLWEKFADCAGRVLAASDVTALASALDSFPEYEDVRDFVQLAQATPARQTTLAGSAT
ncbi:MmgE/PrpD family protein [Amycolatopsis sp. cmx-8-4]|uniref:MmgE/PrpD family protein n=1 Tax=Amycolatopsis sp. cmx-8-4 TaxID=2790947 RepID=UPI00397C7816